MRGEIEKGMRIKGGGGDTGNNEGLKKPGRKRVKINREEREFVIK